MPPVVRAIFAFAAFSVHAAPLPQLTNLSIRSNSGLGSDTLIVGFGIAGSGDKPLLIRGVGPTLATFGVSGVLADPSLQLAAAGGAVLAQNDNWDGSIADVAARVGAFALPANSRDAALVQTLPIGSYTARIGGGSGVALVELYDTAPSSSRLVNVSARTRTAAGGDVLIAGFAITGSGSQTLLIRAVGPSLTSFGVDGALVDPALAVYAGSSLIAANDDWGGGSILATAAAQVGAFTLPANSLDAAVLVTLPAGSYTAQVSGAKNSSGVVLVEIYEAAGSTPAQPTAVLDLFATENSSPTRLFRLSPATGATTPVASVRFYPGITFRRNGALYGASTSLSTFSAQTGAATVLGTLPDLITGLAFAPDDSLYGISNDGLTLYKLDPRNGSAIAAIAMSGTTHASGTPFPGEINGIAFGADGTLYGIGFSLYTIDSVSGVATKVSTTGRQVSGDLFTSLDMGPDGVLRGTSFGIGTNVSSVLFTVDAHSGIGQSVGAMGAAIAGIASHTVGTTAVASAASIRMDPRFAEPDASILRDAANNARAARIRAELEDAAQAR